MVPLSKSSCLSLYRQLLQAGQQFHDTNFRSYAIRRIRERFADARSVAPNEAEELYQNGLKELAVIKRQAELNRMFAHGKALPICQMTDVQINSDYNNNGFTISPYKVSVVVLLGMSNLLTSIRMRIKLAVCSDVEHFELFCYSKGHIRNGFFLS